MKILLHSSLSSLGASGCVGRLLLVGSVAAGTCLASGCNALLGAAGPPSNAGGTQFSGTTGANCDLAYYDADFGYGFDLPAQAELVRSDNEQDALTNSLWTVTVDGVLINVTARVQDEAGGATLSDIVQAQNDDTLFAGGDLLLEETVTLANGGEAVHTIINFDGLTTSRAQALSNNHLYTVEFIVATDSRTNALDTLAADTVLSLCVD